MGLKKDTIKGVIWSGLGTVGSGVIGFVVTIILARTLTPEAFGVIELILSFVVVSEVLVDCGLSKAIIRDKEVSQTDLSTIFYMNMIVAIFLYTIIFISAPLIAEYYSSSQDFVLLLRTLSFKIVVDAFSFTQVALCNRNMRFKELSIITTISMFFAGLISVVLIYKGFGVWALVSYYLFLSIFKALLIGVQIKWWPTLVFDLKRAKYFLGFGGPLMIVQVIDKTVTSVESLMVGKVYTKTDLGYFSQARKFDSLVIQTLLGIVQKVTYPALSKTQSAHQLTLGYKEVMQVSLWAITPIACFTFFNAEAFMCTVFGPQWAASADYLQIFSIFSLVFPLYSICYNVFYVTGETTLLLKLSVFQQVFRILVIVVMIKFGLTAFAGGIVAVMCLSSLLFIYYSGKLIEYPMKQMFRDNMNTVLCSIMATGFAKILSMTFEVQGTFLFWVLLGVSVALYFALNVLFRNRAYRTIVDILKKVRK